MSDEKGSLEYLPIYSFLFSNEKGSSLYNAYVRDEVEDKLPLRAVIDIDASKEDMETANVKGQEVFIRICCSFIRVLYRILDCGWKDILKG
ncbi:8310_t:CDS:2, partial [Funneliformis geosporum]